MTVYISRDDSYALEHHGVKGMKWGVRKDTKAKLDEKWNKRNARYEKAFNRYGNIKNRQLKADAKRYYRTERFDKKHPGKASLLASRYLNINDYNKVYSNYRAGQQKSRQEHYEQKAIKNINKAAKPSNAKSADRYYARGLKLAQKANFYENLSNFNTTMAEAYKKNGETAMKKLSSNYDYTTKKIERTVESGYYGGYYYTVTAPGTKYKVKRKKE